MDMKLKCIFEFTEEEQQKLQHLKQVSDAPSNTSQQSSTTLSNTTSSQKSTSSTGGTKQQQQANSSSSSSSKTDVYSSADTHANDFESMTSLNTNTGIINPTTTTTTSRSGAGSVAAKTATTTSDSKNENTLNELKFYKQENEVLKKEVNRLKVSTNAHNFQLFAIYSNPTPPSQKGRRTSPAKAGSASAISPG